MSSDHDAANGPYPVLGRWNIRLHDSPASGARAACGTRGKHWRRPWMNKSLPFMHSNAFAAVEPSAESDRASDYRAAVITAPGILEVRRIAAPVVPVGHVLVRITHCGICASNVPPWQGRPWFSYPLRPGALGHEAIGNIEEVGDGVEGWAPGDGVAYIGEHGYAEREVVPAESLFPLPTHAGEELFLGEPLACAMNIFRRSGIQPGDNVAVVGTGFLGVLLVQLATRAGANVFAIGRRPETLEFAEKSGATPIVAADRNTGVQAVADLTRGELCNVVIEATGHQEPLDLAGEITRVRGRLVIAGYHQDSPRPINLQLWNWRGLDVINAHERDPAVYLEGMRLAQEAIAQKRLSTKGLITHEFPLEELGTGLTMAAERPAGFLKGVVRL